MALHTSGIGGPIAALERQADEVEFLVGEIVAKASFDLAYGNWMKTGTGLG